MTIKPRAMRDVFLEQILASMHTDDKIFFVSADFGSPVLDNIRTGFPDRFLNVGVAEQNLINITAGLALEGYKVFAYAIAPFITMRCYEQTRISLALLSKVRPISATLIGVGAGYSYVVSGPTHQCYEDITLMRALPNFRVLSPADHIITSSMFDLCNNETGLNYLRLDAQILPAVYSNDIPELDRGFHVHRTGKQICIIATGYMLHTAMKVAETFEQRGHSTGIIDLFNLSGFDASALAKSLSSYTGVITMEEGFHGRGGMDSMIFEFISRLNLPIRVLNLGVQNQYSFTLGNRTELHEMVGIGPKTVTASIENFIDTL